MLVIFYVKTQIRMSKENKKKMALKLFLIVIFIFFQWLFTIYICFTCFSVFCDFAFSLTWWMTLRLFNVYLNKNGLIFKVIIHLLLYLIFHYLTIQWLLKWVQWDHKKDRWAMSGKVFPVENAKYKSNFRRCGWIFKIKNTGYSYCVCIDVQRIQKQQM